ncbi:MAG: DUF2341 domain-containing protein [Candidatus Bathyarchaeota archaeon]|nr:DUF2341 domain-containing protein [Candidatus Bathyarchaeota archaeon]MDW8022394.1 DUF2341 domain-containing protein [Nitrososphaerota archaeon]
MKNKLLTLTIILSILLNLLILLTYKPAMAQNWLPGWNYRKSHVINPASGAGTNYQIRIKVNYGSGTDSGENVYVAGKCRTDFGDIRFTRSDGTTLLDYWMETKVDGQYAVFWVKIPDDLSSSPVTIYVYYGKSDATTTSNGDATFLFFDGFDGTSLNTTKWTVKAGSPVVENGYVRISGDYSRIQTKSTFSRPFAIGIRARMDSTAQYNAIDNYLCATDGFTRISGTGYVWMVLSNYYTYTIAFQKTVGGSQTWLKGSGVKLDSTAWRKYELLAGSSTFRFFYGEPPTEDTPSITDTSITTSGYILLCCYGTSGNRFWDYIYVRKYVSPEPSHGSWGSEEVSVIERFAIQALTVNQTPFRQASFDRAVLHPVKILMDTSRVLGLLRNAGQLVNIAVDANRLYTAKRDADQRLRLLVFTSRQTSLNRFSHQQLVLLTEPEATEVLARHANQILIMLSDVARQITQLRFADQRLETLLSASRKTYYNRTAEVLLYTPAATYVKFIIYTEVPTPTPTPAPVIPTIRLDVIIQTAHITNFWWKPTSTIEVLIINKGTSASDVTFQCQIIDRQNNTIVEETQTVFISGLDKKIVSIKIPALPDGKYVIHFKTLAPVKVEAKQVELVVETPFYGKPIFTFSLLSLTALLIILLLTRRRR